MPALHVRQFDESAITAPRALVKPRAHEHLDLEIGCGVGWHPIQYAKENPGRHLVAIEQTREKFQSFARRAQKHALANLTPVHADAVRWVTHALTPQSLERIFILYPNPEPRASNRRWVRMPFFAKLLEALKPGGTLTLATNIEAYAQEAAEYALHFWQLETLGPQPYAGPARTHFEKKYLERGETCFNVTFRKPSASLRP